MTVLRPGVAESDSLRDDSRPLDSPPAAPLVPPPADVSNIQKLAPSITNVRLIQLHDSMAELFASQGRWQEAYQSLRSALELLYQEQSGERVVPEPVRREFIRLRREHAEAREQSLRDSLTASYNRRYLDQRLFALLSERNYEVSGLAVALVDLDHFKQVNDTFGHLIGDRVLQCVVEVLQNDLPEGAFCARYGGEEFVLVVPGVDTATAVAVCEAARARVERYAWNELAPDLEVTVSIGLAHEPIDFADSENKAANLDPKEQLLRADSLLYMAKESGRNAVAYREGGLVRLAGEASGRRAFPKRINGS